MREPERWKPVFIFVFTSVVLAILGVWMAWVRETERWWYLAGYYAVMFLVIWRLWNYRSPD